MSGRFRRFLRHARGVAITSNTGDSLSSSDGGPKRVGVFPLGAISQFATRMPTEWLHAAVGDSQVESRYNQISCTAYYFVTPNSAG